MFKFLDKLALNKGLMLLLCSIALALLCVELCVAVSRGKLHARAVITTACKAILLLALAFLAGFLISLIPASGVLSTVLFYALMVLILAAVVIIFVIGQRKQVRLATANALRKSAAGTAAVRHAKGWLYGTSFALIIAAAVALATGRADYYMPMFAVAVTAVALLLGSVLLPRLWYALAAIASIAFFAVTFYPQFISAQPASLAVISLAMAAVSLLAASFISLTIKKE